MRGKIMDVQITSEKENPLLKRKEVSFQLEHGQAGSTPARLEIRKAVAGKLKTSEDLVFVKRFNTKTGTHVARGIAHVYDSVEQAKVVEPKYMLKRYAPPEKPKEETK